VTLQLMILMTHVHSTLSVSSASAFPRAVTVIPMQMIQIAFAPQMKFAKTARVSHRSPPGVTVIQRLIILMNPAQLTLSVSSASVFPRAVTVIPMQMIQIAIVL